MDIDRLLELHALHAGRRRGLRHQSSEARTGARTRLGRSRRCRSLGYEPFDVSAESRGYDIESRDPETGGLRFIKVKGRSADAQAIAIMRNEMLTALNPGDSFILAAVLVEDGFTHQPLYVTNPAPLFGAEPGFNEVQRGPPGDFRPLNQGGGAGRRGRRVVDGDHRESRLYCLMGYGIGKIGA